MGVNYRKIVTVEPGKRGGRPTVRGMRIIVYDVHSYLAAGMCHGESSRTFPTLQRRASSLTSPTPPTVRGGGWQPAVKLLFDQNLSPKLVERLADIFSR